MRGQVKNFVRGDFGQREQLIGLWGIEHGCGVTHMALAIATYVKTMWKCKVAYVAYHAHFTVGKIAFLNQKQGDYFVYHGIDCYHGMSKEQLLERCNRKYEYIILDFGILRSQPDDMVKMCNQRFILACSAEWRIGYFYEWLKGKNKEEMRTYKFLLPFANRTCLDDFMHEYDFDFISIPYQQSPFSLNPAMLVLLNDLIEGE